MTVDRREYPRLEEEFPLRFEIVSSTLPTPLIRPGRRGIGNNISGGGLSIVIVSRLWKNTAKKLLDHSLKLSLEFYLSGTQHRIRALGEVQWTKEEMHWWQIWPKRWSMGIKLTYIQFEDRACIVKYVSKQIEDYLVKP